MCCRIAPFVHTHSKGLHIVIIVISVFKLLFFQCLKFIMVLQCLNVYATYSKHTYVLHLGKPDFIDLTCHLAGTPVKLLQCVSDKKANIHSQSFYLARPSHWHLTVKFYSCYSLMTSPQQHLGRDTETEKKKKCSNT